MSTCLIDCPSIFDLERELDETFRDCAIAFENSQFAYAQNDPDSFNVWRAMHEVSSRKYKDLLSILADCSPTIH